ncbi:hypothetical protein RQP46_002793 [Phenoliferia psychrophenolica]
MSRATPDHLGTFESSYASLGIDRWSRREEVVLAVEQHCLNQSPVSTSISNAIAFLALKTRDTRIETIRDVLLHRASQALYHSFGLNTPPEYYQEDLSTLEYADQNEPPPTYEIKRVVVDAGVQDHGAASAPPVVVSKLPPPSISSLVSNKSTQTPPSTEAVQIAKLTSEIVRMETEIFRQSGLVDRWKGVAAEHLERLADSQPECDEALRSAAYVEREKGEKKARLLRRDLADMMAVAHANAAEAQTWKGKYYTYQWEAAREEMADRRWRYLNRAIWDLNMKMDALRDEVAVWKARYEGVLSAKAPTAKAPSPPAHPDGWDAGPVPSSTSSSSASSIHSEDPADQDDPEVLRFLVTYLRGEIASLHRRAEAQVAHLRDKIATLEKQIEAPVSRKSVDDTKQRMLDNALAELEAMQRSHEYSVSNFRDQIRAYEEALAAREKDVDLWKSTATLLQAQVNEFEGKIAAAIKVAAGFRQLV